MDLPLAPEENARDLGAYDLGDRASAFTLHQGDAVIHASCYGMPGYIGVHRPVEGAAVAGSGSYNET